MTCKSLAIEAQNSNQNSKCIILTDKFLLVKTTLFRSEIISVINMIDLVKKVAANSPTSIMLWQQKLLVR